MFKKNFMIKGLAYLLSALLLATAIPVNSASTVYAASVSTFSSSKKDIVCGKSAKIKLPSGYRNTKFSSSNKKVATVSSKGVVKAVRLGIAKITAKSGSKTKTYTITVKPAKASEVWLSQEAILTGQKLTFRLASDKYDVSQVKLKFSSAYSQIDSSGKCSGISGSGAIYMTGSLNYSYGQFGKTCTLQIFSPDWIYRSLLGSTTGNVNIYAGTSYSGKVSLSGGKTITLSQLRKKGISIQLDGQNMPNSIICTAGKHTLTIASGSEKKEIEIGVSYTVKDALLNRDANGFSDSAKAVFDASFTALDQILTDGMSDEQKVKAIHDYLIYNANYVNNGDYTTASSWAYGAGGVLLHGEGVCQSYAIAFYMMAIAAGLDCKYVTGTATSSGSSGGHAWNYVCVSGTWYYIDCTWDDPIGPTGAGGYEQYTYYLSQSCWSDHTIESISDLANESKSAWEDYYLTGEKY